MNASHGDASARPVGNYLHGCNSSELISPRSLGCAASRHGTRVAYDTYGCRCPDAREQSNRARAFRQLRAMREGPGYIPAVGAVRRLRALAAIGWGLEALAPHLGWHWQRLGQIRSGRQTYIHRETHLAIAGLYDKLSDDHGPSARSVAYARRRRWLPPLEWDDDTIDDPRAQSEDAAAADVIDSIAIERFVAGDDTVTLTRTEKAEAYQAFLAHGISHNQAAIRLKLSGSTAKKLADHQERSVMTRDPGESRPYQPHPAPALMWQIDCQEWLT